MKLILRGFTLAVFLAGSLLSHTGVLKAQDTYLLQLKEVIGTEYEALDSALLGSIQRRAVSSREGDTLQKDEVLVGSEPLYSLEIKITTGEEFYFRTVADGYQTVFTGSAKEHPNGPAWVSVEYFYRRGKVGTSAVPTVMEGNIALRVHESQLIEQKPNDETVIDPLGDRRSRMELQKLDSEPVRRMVMNLESFVHYAGYRDINSGVTVRLVDKNGDPVVDAGIALFDSDFELAVGSWPPSARTTNSDTNGIVSISEGREALPLYTLFAYQLERGLAAVVNLDRNQAHHYSIEHPPYTVVMKDDILKPEE